MQLLREQTIMIPVPKSKTSTAGIGRHRRATLAVAVFFLGGSVFATIMIGLWSSKSIPFERGYLVPWIVLVLVVTLIPSCVLIIRRRFRLYHPLVYASFFYFLPVFVLGSSYLISGNYQPWYLDFVPDPRYNIPLALAYVALGFAGLSVGFALPIGRRVGYVLSRHLPQWNWHPSDIIGPSLLLLLLGQAFGLITYFQGSLGYQYNSDAVSTFGTFFYSLFSLYHLGAFLLWFAVFRAYRSTARYRAIIILLVGASLFTAVMGGGKGGLFSGTVAVIMAYLLAGRRVRLRRGMFISLILVVALLIGTIFGLEFRQQKNEQETVGLWEYLGIIGNTIQRIARQDQSASISQATQAVMQRSEMLSTFAVIVGNYERLRPLEAQYGLANDIWIYTWTAFIPRFLWPEKPLISDARALGALYFGYGSNSFAITPMGDLLRNYGPIGILVGMAVLGVLLRIIYGALVENQRITAWRASLFMLLLSGVSYEGFYGTILPRMMREGIMIVFGLFLVNIWINRHKGVSYRG